MLTPPILVQPAPGVRRAFAQWATSRTPKVRTVSPVRFAVPSQLFTDIPEALLIGALVDGHRYVSPDEDEALGVAGPGAAVLPEQEATPGDALRPLPDEAYAPDAEPLDDTPAADLPEPDTSEDPEETPEGVFPCPSCEREFTSARGLRTHRRQAHTETED
ncbi:hypothetical protein ACFY0N_00385 [Streptomyces vinaceus]|uniref:C2H2-type zinc finger protein n=1 Tax=Streptomyces vinaceus TaxID=1960 RepID=UPI0036CC1280